MSITLSLFCSLFKTNTDLKICFFFSVRGLFKRRESAEKILIGIIVYLLAQYELSCNLIGSLDVYCQQILPFRGVTLHFQGR